MFVIENILDIDLDISLRKISKFHLISWWVNFMEMRNRKLSEIMVFYAALFSLLSVKLMLTLTLSNTKLSTGLMKH